MVSMNLSRLLTSAFICIRLVVVIVPVSVAAALAQTNATTVTDAVSSENLASTVTTDTTPFTAAATLSASAAEAATTSSTSSSTDGLTSSATTDLSSIAANTTLLSSTEGRTNMSISTTAASSVTSNTNASSVSQTTTSTMSSQGATYENFSIPTTGTQSSTIDRNDTSSQPSTTSPRAPSASSSSVYNTTTSVAVESTATTAVGTSTVRTTDSGMTLPVTQIIIVTVSSVTGGTLVIIIIIGVAVYCCRRRRHFRRRQNQNPPAEIMPPVKIPARSKAVNLADFTEYVNHLSADSDYGFAEEFEELEDAGAGQSITVAKEERNRPKNRYSDILPYDHSRVKLHTSVISDKSDYINANYIPGHSGPKEFIATQGPLLVTADDFWRMVWEQQCKAIVMLTRCTEGLVEKCYHYWPSGHDPVVYGDVIVQVTDELEQPQWTVTNFSLSLGAKAHSDNTDTPQAAVRHVRHFHFTAFPDHRAPLEVESMLQFVRMVRSKLQPATTAGGGGGGPVIVHCSAGVGRTGTFIAIDHLLQQIDEGRLSVDIFGLVREMRLHRMSTVQTEEQYIFIYKIILHVLEKQRNSASQNGGIDNKAFADDPVE